jgi:hypothetical protein
MKTNKLLIFGLAALSLVFTNCNKEEETSQENVAFNFGQVVSRSFEGKVVDENNNPISNAVVSLSGQLTTTDANGKFSLLNVPVLERLGYIKTVKEGYLDGSRTVMSHEGLNKVSIMMLTQNLTETIATGEVSVVSLPNSTKVTFDGAFMNENGQPYTGNVDVYMHHLDAADPYVFDKMPGNLIGTRTDGSVSGMETYGMVNVELRGEDGQELQIASGHTANLSLPIAPNQLDTAPATIPLWHFNETSGLWEEQGFSRRVGNRYVGNVSHFTWWNNDYAYVVATLTTIVTNFDGTPVNGVRVTISRPNGSSGDVLMDLGVTGANGTLTAGVPRNEVLTFRAYSTDGQLISTQILPASNELSRTVYVVIPIINKNAAPNKL